MHDHVHKPSIDILSKTELFPIVGKIVSSKMSCLPGPSECDIIGK